MNELIEKIFKQARDRARRQQIVDDEFLNIFAALIVKECIGVLETNKVNLTIDNQLDTIFEIENHFGVK